MEQFKSELTLLNEITILNINPFSKKDTDLAIIVDSHKNQIKKIFDIISIAEKYSPKFEFYCRHCDFVLLNQKKNKIHFLLYPNYYYLVQFETPSFLRSLLTNSRIEAGSLVNLELILRKLNNCSEISIDFNSKTFYQYLLQAIENYFYLKLNHNVFTVTYYEFNLEYLIRYSATESYRFGTGKEIINILDQNSKDIINYFPEKLIQDYFYIKQNHQKNDLSFYLNSYQNLIEFISNIIFTYETKKRR